MRMTLGHLMGGIAVLAVVLALAMQYVVLHRRAVALERWGQSLRQRERYLRQRAEASRLAAQAQVGLDARSPDRALLDEVQEIGWNRHEIEWPLTHRTRRQGSTPPTDVGTPTDGAGAGEPEPDSIP
jgi:hypothetical protein